MVKQALDFDQMVDYLEKNKNVQFGNVDKKSASDIILKYGYFNVITPFKYYFADRDPINKNESLLIEGKHQYSTPFDFSDWYDRFINERSRYPKIYNSVVNIKTVFKNVMFNKIYCQYNFDKKDDMKSFISIDCRLNAMSRFDHIEMDYINNSLEHILEMIEKSYSVFYIVGNIGFGDSNNLFRCLDQSLQNEIIFEMQRLKLAPVPTNPNEFYKRMSIIQKVRNCIMHNDSLEVLCRYKLRDKKRSRSSKERLSYVNIANQLYEMDTW